MGLLLSHQPPLTNCQFQEPPTSYEPPVASSTTLGGYIKGCLFSIFILLSAFFGSVYVLFPITPLIYLSPHTYRRIVDFLIGYWLVLPSGLIELLWGAEFTVSGERIDGGKPALVLMNHRTRLDWLFYWSALFRVDPTLLTSCKISLKGILKHLPGAGWAMASNAFMFLDRSFAKDKERLVGGGTAFQIL